MSYAKDLMALTDEQLAEQLTSPSPGSPNHEAIKFEMQRRAMLAQDAAAKATLRGAIAAERYTTATWCLIVVSVISVAVAIWK